jgi:2-keto-4-pentenoate hydratase/2-oxohepta-3-ene-1,7-dioic acid hydratase in catechol pathway
VNGQVRQTAKTDDLIFDSSSIIRFLSRGRTLQPGTVIMTGTPSGVQAGSNSPTWLKNGDVVEVGIEGIGKISNRLMFETPGFQL